MLRFQLLLLVVFCCSMPAVAADDWKPPTGKKAIDLAVKDTVEEYDALSKNHDLIPNRRRRLLILRLGQLPTPKCVKVLRRIVRKEQDTRAKINAMFALVQIGDVKAVNDMYKYCLKEIRSVYPAYLGRALSRTTDVEVKEWILEKPLKYTHMTVRLSAIEAVGNLRYAPSIPQLIAIYEREVKKAANRDIVVLYESLRAMGRIGGPAARSVLHRAAEDKDWRLRLGVAESLLEHYRGPESLKIMRALMKEDSQIIREECAKSVGRNKVEALFPELITTMIEGNLRCKKAAWISLKNISGQDYSLAPDVWTKWWSEKEKGKLSAAGKIGNGEGITVSTYYNFKIFSDRVMFVVDTSGSMKWMQAPPQRIDVARRQLVMAIKSLDEKTLFNVMTFASDMHQWQREGVVPATEKNVEDSLKWIKKRLLARGGTNTWGAIERTLKRNPKIDTVHFLSDGLPSSGSMEVQEEILVALRDVNRFRKVVFNTIALVFGKSQYEKAWKYEDPAEMGAFMRRIAEETGGSSVVIDRPFFDLKD